VFLVLSLARLLLTESISLYGHVMDSSDLNDNLPNTLKYVFCLCVALKLYDS
jgi:hypothetical protein